MEFYDNILYSLLSQFNVQRPLYVSKPYKYDYK